MTEDCFGEQCRHRSIRMEDEKPDYKETALRIEQELRRQLWFSMRDADLIYQANPEHGD